MIDLHMHSRYSENGEYTLSELVQCSMVLRLFWHILSVKDISLPSDKQSRCFIRQTSSAQKDFIAKLSMYIIDSNMYYIVFREKCFDIDTYFFLCRHSPLLLAPIKRTCLRNTKWSPSSSSYICLSICSSFFPAVST